MVTFNHFKRLIKVYFFNLRDVILILTCTMHNIFVIQNFSLTEAGTISYPFNNHTKHKMFQLINYSFHVLNSIFNLIVFVGFRFRTKASSIYSGFGCQVGFRLDFGRKFPTGLDHCIFWYSFTVAVKST